VKFEAFKGYYVYLLQTTINNLFKTLNYSELFLKEN